SGTFNDGTTLDLSNSAVWSSSLPSVATVTQFGLAVSAGQGVTTIKAESGGLSGSALLTITAPELLSIFLAPAYPLVQLGNTLQFSATGVFTSGSPQDLTNSVV